MSIKKEILLRRMSNCVSEEEAQTLAAELVALNKREEEVLQKHENVEDAMEELEFLEEMEERREMMENPERDAREQFDDMMFLYQQAGING